MMGHSAWYTALVIALGYLVLLIGIEIWHIWKKPAVELTRKFAHVTAGIVCASFSYIFESHWIVLLMAASFVIVMIVTKKAGLLNGIHAVDRTSEGAVYFPIGVYLTFLLSSSYNHPEFYTLSILVLTIADTLAALIGIKYGSKIYHVGKRARKSIEGSAAFFVSAFIIVLVGLLLLSDLGRLESILCAVLVTLVATGLEFISRRGADNLFIPLGVWLVLRYSTALSAADIVLDLVIISFISGITYAIVFLPKVRLGTSSFVGISLLGYGLWTLGIFDWV